MELGATMDRPSLIWNFTMVAKRTTDQQGFKIDEYPGGQTVMIAISGFADRGTFEYEADWRLYADKPFNGEHPVASGRTDRYTTEDLAVAAATRAAVEQMKP